MADSDSVQTEGLLRVIGTGAVALAVVNMVIGAGIFALPGSMAPLAGIPYDRWLRFVMPFMIKIGIVGSLALVVAVLIGYS
jgi:amino acid transporter